MKLVRKSAGILLFRNIGHLEIFLVHPGGPFWANKDDGAWSIPKGEYSDNEEALEAAIREFKEETGLEVRGDFMPLEPVLQKAGKQVLAWAVEGDVDAKAITSNAFKMEWPPRSGKFKSFPEVDKAAWFALDKAKQKINPAQIGLIEQLHYKLSQ
jgi:predicted NUDIX family NTP pyrophosphohydrolase